MKEMKKIVLAYSGGLDTTVIIPWLKENYNCQVIAVAADVGQAPSELVGLKEKAYATGADGFYLEDLKEEFVNDYVFPAIKMGATYENYLLGTALARPIIGKRLVEIALKENADAIAHGCTGKGNDQVRFELAIKAFAPNMEIIAPWRIWDLQGREDEIAYAESKGIPWKFSAEESYSKDMNLWHLSHEGLDLEDPMNEPDYDSILEMGVSPEMAPDKPTYVTLDFEKGIPVALDGVKMNGVQLIEKLNQIGGANGIGTLDLLENRLVGMKCRGVYETPGGAILYAAHGVLEDLCLDKDTAHFKEHLSLKFGELAYNGLWFTPLMDALQSFSDTTQETVTGSVKLKLYKGNIIPAGVESPYGLYSQEVVTFGKETDYNQKDSEGFINLYGLPIQIRAQMKEKWNIKEEV